MTKYILPNRIEYIDYIQNKFHPEKITDTRSFDHQVLVDKYLDIQSPYRGLLLYHELGTGKSATSIKLVNQYLKTTKKIYVILPASLRNNYIKELLKHSKYFKFYKTDAKWLFNEKGKVKIADNGRTYKECEDDEKKKIEKEIENIILKRIKFISYNGLTQNIIDELQESINTDALKKYLYNLKWKRTYKQTKTSIKDKFGITIDLSYFKKDDSNKRYILLPELISGLETKESTKDDIETIKEITKIIVEDGLKFIKKFNISDINIYNSAFSNSLIVIDEAHSFIRTVSNNSKFAEPLYNNIMNAKNCKILLLSGTPIINNPYEVLYLFNLLRGPMKTYHFNDKIDLSKISKYIDINEKTHKKQIVQFLPENFVRHSNNYIHFEQWNLPKLLQSISDIKIPSTTNYVFPPSIETFKKLFYNYVNNEHEGYNNTDIFKRRINGLVSFVDKDPTKFPEQYDLEIKYVSMSNHQFKLLLDKLEIEAKIDAKKKNPINDNSSSVYKTYSRAVSNFVFPEDIERKFPADMKKLLTNYDDDNYDGENDYDIHLKTIKNKFITKYNTSNDEEQKQLLKTCSAKYMEIIKDIEIHKTKGKILIYSQFRTLEGVGMLSVYLDLMGYGKVEYCKDQSSVTKDCKYKNNFKIPKDKTNYMIYDLNKDIAREQIKLFNDKDNIKGDDIKILIITLSGAEGISLTNVRSVLILEPHWNMTVLKQVIGRAVRNGSHLELDHDERNVKPIIYLTTATESQKNENQTFRIRHESTTTDELIYTKAKIKQKNIDLLLDLMKESAFDCNIHARKNDIQIDKWRCYQWAYNLPKDTEVYKANIDDEQNHMQHKNYEKEKKIKGKIVEIELSNNEKLNVVEYDGLYYDLNAYKYAKQLIPFNKELYELKLNYKQSHKDPKDPKQSPKDQKDPSPKQSPKDQKDPSPKQSPKDQSPKAIKDNFSITIDPNDKLYDPNYNKKYKVVDATRNGSCFYNAIYIVLKHKKNIMKFIKCFNLRSGKKETIKEKEFVNWLRIETLKKKTEKGNDKELSKNTYTNLINLPIDVYRTHIDEAWQIKELEKKPPKSLTEFRKIIAEYIGDTTKYANEYDKDLIDAFIKGVFKISVMQTLPNLDYNFEEDTIYLLRINNNHYQAILVI
jgi:hypothetical protein